MILYYIGMAFALTVILVNLPTWVSVGWIAVALIVLFFIIW